MLINNNIVTCWVCHTTDKFMSSSDSTIYWTLTLTRSCTIVITYSITWLLVQYSNTQLWLVSDSMLILQWLFPDCPVCLVCLPILLYSSRRLGLYRCSADRIPDIILHASVATILTVRCYATNLCCSSLWRFGVLYAAADRVLCYHGSAYSKHVTILFVIIYMYDSFKLLVCSSQFLCAVCCYEEAILGSLYICWIINHLSF
jgi:hypothetical protein